jgi:hypothetical protein
MRLFKFILPWLIWSVSTFITIDNDLPTDGSAKIGFPCVIVSITHNPIIGEYSYRFSKQGVILNFLFILLIYIGIYFLIKRKRATDSNKKIQAY